MSFWSDSKPRAHFPLLQLPTRHQIPKMLLQSIPVGLGKLYCISHRHTPVFASKLHNL